uniref:Uncharacterized protein n=1 Tax=Rhizophagus irregularis (strain DAOM 181602 / DAOM 197198 / MUCL 43194) TaxID=747089 RepID=U9URR3_RHIID
MIKRSTRNNRLIHLRFGQLAVGMGTFKRIYRILISVRSVRGVYYVADFLFISMTLTLIAKFLKQHFEGLIPFKDWSDVLFMLGFQENFLIIRRNKFIIDLRRRLTILVLPRFPRK